VNYKKFLPFLLAFVLPILAVYAWWGGFNPVDIREGVRGPYTYAYLEHTGDYSKLPDVADEVRGLLKDAKVAYGLPITILYSNPDLVDVGKRRSHTGYLVAADAKVRAPLKIDSLPARPVLIAQVRAGRLLAPSRAYPALDRYLQARGSGIRMPTVEIYEPSGTPLRMGLLTVEMPRP
jgi:hypothetical protein